MNSYCEYKFKKKIDNEWIQKKNDLGTSDQIIIVL